MQDDAATPMDVGSNAGLASTATAAPMEGTWRLVAPDGREWVAESPLHCVREEMRERVPPSVQLARVLAAAEESDLAERHVQLGAFYGVKHTDDLIDAMEKHIESLQRKTLMPVAKVAEVHMSRYTIEWLGRVWPEGTLLCWALPKMPELSFAPTPVRVA